VTTADVIVNCRARHLFDGAPLRAVLAREVRRAGARLHETRSLADLDQAARAIAQTGTSAVVLAGGDGSHMAGVSALARAFGAALPRVGLAPGGTVCTVARNLGMRGPGHSWAEPLIRAACGEEGARVATRPTLRVRDDAGGDRVGFIFGAGLVARFFDAYYAAPTQGLAPAARIAARVFAGSLVGSREARRMLAPTACSIAVDGAAATPPSAQGWSLVLASVVRDVGLHAVVAYRAGELPGRFHVVASGLPAQALGLQVPRVLSGRPMRGEGHVDALARSLLVSFEEPGAYVLDGDVMRAGEARVEAGPALEIVLPMLPDR
jgi:diacylglycerol kinase family enzyme